jgi:hypothetical protein
MPTPTFAEEGAMWHYHAAHLILRVQCSTKLGRMASAPRQPYSILRSAATLGPASVLNTSSANDLQTRLSQRLLKPCNPSCVLWLLQGVWHIFWRQLCVFFLHWV